MVLHIRIIVPVFLSFMSLLLIVSASNSRKHPVVKNCERNHPVSLEKKVAKSSIVVKTLMTRTVDKKNFHHPNEILQNEKSGGTKVFEFWILDVYKGEEKLANHLGILNFKRQDLISKLRDR